MKKRFKLWDIGSSFPKMSLKMKLTVFLTIVSLFQIQANTYSQSKKITLDMPNATVEEVIQEIESLSDFKFLLNRKDVDLKREVSIKVEKEKIATVLSELFAGTDVDYEVLKKQIILRKDHENTTPTYVSKTLLPNNTAIQFQVSGTITDTNGAPLPGANILEKGTTNGVQTDFDGNFSIELFDENATLVVSYIGFGEKEVAVNGQTTINVQLEESAQGLDEVVVVGYGTLSKKDLTGAVATISTEQLANRPVVSYQEALAGQMAGVQIQQISAAPGNEGLAVRVRGSGSITAGQDPLYVIDGYPVEGSGFSLVNPSDIESIQVLKDASSTAIYGSRGSNGVVIVTTKKGKIGKPRISYNTYFGIQQVAKKFDMMNKEQYLEFFKDGHNQAWLDRPPLPGDAPHTINDPNSLRETYSNSSFYTIPDDFNDPNNFVDTDWQDELFRSAPTQRHELSLSGGTENTRYFVSTGYTKQDGILINSDYRLYNLRTNLTSNINDKLTVGINFSGYYSDKNSLDEGKDSPLAYAIYAPPIYPVRNSDGTYGSQVRNREIWAGDVASPIGIAENITNFTNSNGFIASLYAEYSILENLKYKLSLNGSTDNRRLKYYRPSFVDTDGSRAPKTADARNETWLDKNWLIEHTLNYNTTFSEKHSLNVLAGFTAQNFYFEYARANAQNFPNDAVRTLNAGQIVGGESTESRNSLLSYLGRINYAYDNRYLLTASIRSDGSSKFGKNNRWGTFPSVSLGWRIDQENFMDNVDAVSDLKIRGSWGLVGNNKIGDYGSIGLTSSSYYVLNGNLANAVNPNTFANSDLGWETTEQYNLGLDLGLFSNRVRLEADFYRSRSVDLLLDVPVPTLTGYDSQLQNIGEIENKGMEFLLRTQNVTGDFQWSTDFNISFNKNKVLALGPDGRPIFAGAPNAGNTFITTIGKPIATFYGYLYDGVFLNQKELDASPHLPNDFPGDPRYVDLNGDGVLDADDKTYIGDNQPDFMYGINNDFSYKNIDLSIQLTGSQGARTFSFFNRMVGIYHGDRNGLIKLTERWRSESDPGNGYILRANRDPKGLQKEPSSYWVENASFLRIRNVSLGYNFDQQLLDQLRISALRIYVTGQNLYTFTKYPGYDPETSSQGQGLSRGGDYLGYPSARTIMLGLNIGF